MDYSIKILSTFDLVIASDHITSIWRKKKRLMQHLIGAIANPYDHMTHDRQGCCCAAKATQWIIKQVIEACAVMTW